MANEDSSGDDNAQVKEAVEDIVSIFRESLEAKGTSYLSIQDEVDEVDEVVDFYRQYLNPEESYKKLWYKIFTAPDARKWPTVILLSELLFSPPFTNSTVERAFSIMNIIKNDRRTSLNDDDLMEINVEGPPPEDFSSEHAVSLWWKDCTRRPNQARRKEYRQRATGSDDTGSRESGSMEPSRSTMTLDAWDDWMVIDASNSDS